MRCGSCGVEPAPGARFCSACGAPAGRRCDVCGAALAPDARFCGGCGARAAPVAAEVAGAGGGRERKVATALFADIVGYTGLNEAQDAEVVEAVVGSALDRLRREVERYEGLVEKFAGDAVFALFGVPATHEDDPERAVRAALEMQAAMLEHHGAADDGGEPRLSLRIGIESGEVLVDAARARLERERMVTGDSVNTAARLQAIAAPGSVLVGPHVYEATRAAIDYESLPPVELKGKALPVPVWRAVSVRAGRGGRRAVLGLKAPLIGRDEELALLKETVRRTVAERRPHLVTVLGSAGVGKSRLSWELETYLDGLPDVWYWRKGRCLPYGQTSYSALADVFKTDAAVLDDEDAPSALAKIRTRVAELAEREPDELITEALRTVLGLQPAATLDRDDLFDAWRGYLGLLTARSPLVLVIEDLHWADEGLLDFLESLARWGDGPVTILCLARHELLERRPGWGGGIPNAASIVLGPLDADESARLLEALLEAPAPPRLRERVVAIGEGNPLFTEELVRMFIDRGVLRFSDGRWQPALSLEDVEVPGSIHALVAARLDSLPASEKRLAQDASVVGRIFWDRPLVELADDDGRGIGELLRRLRVKELVVPREPSSFSDSAEFAFRHLLIRDVAYESLPKLERAEKHCLVASWLEQRLAERHDDLVEIVASHYASAVRYHEELGRRQAGLSELRESLLTYALLAGERSESLWQLDAASRWLRTAVDQSRALGRPPREHVELILRYVRTRGHETAEHPLQATTEAIALLERGGEPAPGSDEARLLARLRSQHVFAQYEAEAVEAARETAWKGIAALDGEPPSPERAELLYRLGWLRWRSGNADEAIEPLQHAIAEARLTGAEEVERWATHDLGVTLAFVDRPNEGVPLLERSMELAEAARDRWLLLRCYINLPAISVESGGDHDRAIALLREGLDRGRRAGDRSTQYWVANNLAATLAITGRLEEAMVYHEEATAAADAFGYARAGYPELAWTLLLMGRRAEARETWERVEATETDPEPQAVTLWAMIRAGLGWPDDPDEAVAALAEVVEDVVRQEHLTAALDGASRLLVRMAVRRGRPDLAEVAARAIERRVAHASGPVRPLQARWCRALVDGTTGDTPTATARADAIAATALELAELGHRLEAADAFADAALLAAVAGRDADAFVREARTRYEACAAVPLLGALPGERAPQ